MIDYAKMERFPGVDHHDTTSNVNEARKLRVIYTVKLDEFNMWKFYQSLKDPAIITINTINGSKNLAHLVVEFQ